MFLKMHTGTQPDFQTLSEDHSLLLLKNDTIDE